MDLKVRSTSPSVSFGGKREVLRNLGRAITSSQYYHLLATTCPQRAETGFHRGARDAFLEALVQDEYFPKLMADIEAHMKEPANIVSGGVTPSMTLPMIAQQRDFDVAEVFKILRSKIDTMIMEKAQAKIPVNLGTDSHYTLAEALGQASMERLSFLQFKALCDALGLKIG